MHMETAEEDSEVLLHSPLGDNTSPHDERLRMGLVLLWLLSIFLLHLKLYVLFLLLLRSFLLLPVSLQLDVLLLLLLL